MVLENRPLRVAGLTWVVVDDILREERIAFNEQLPKLLEEHEEEYTLFYGSSLQGLFPDERSAVGHGYQELCKDGEVAFLVEKVSRDYLPGGKGGNRRIIN